MKIKHEIHSNFSNNINKLADTREYPSTEVEYTPLSSIYFTLFYIFFFHKKDVLIYLIYFKCQSYSFFQTVLFFSILLQKICNKK